MSVWAIHGRAAAHDWIVGVEGDHATTAAALHAATDAREVTTLVTRANFRELTDLAAWLGAHGVRRWTLTIATASGRFEDDPRPWIARLGMAVPHALAAIDRARRSGIEARIEGAPTCLLAPHADWAAPCTPRRYAPRCEGCKLRASCPGVDAWYLDRFGGSELRPA